MVGIRLWAFGLACAACVTGLLVGCHETVKPPRRPLAIGLIAEPIGLDPHRHDDFHSLVVLANIYEGLTRFDAQLRIGPALAVDWENPNNTTWRFHLRPHAKFHDGRPVEAADVVFSLERAVHLPASDFRSYLVSMKSVRAIDAGTVELVTERPAATLLKKLAFVYIVPRDSPEEIKHPVGTGPYALATWMPGKHLELRAFPSYWGPVPVEKTVWLVPMVDVDTKVQRLRAGDLDIAAGLTPQAAAALMKDPCCRVESHDSLIVSHLEVRVDRRPFNDPRVRQAVNLALDRDALLQEVLLGQGRTTGQMVTKNDIGFAADINPPRRDLEKARALLAAAGYPHGIDVELEYRAGVQGASEVQAQLAEAGIRARPVVRSWDELYPRLQVGSVIFQMGSVLAESGDASAVLDPMMHSRGTAAGYGDGNSSGYNNHDLDGMIEQSGLVLDPLKRRELLQRCMRIVSEDLPDIPLFVPFDLYGVRSGVEWRPRFDSLVLAAEARRAAEPD